MDFLNSINLKPAIYIQYGNKRHRINYLKYVKNNKHNKINQIVIRSIKFKFIDYSLFQILFSEFSDMATPTIKSNRLDVWVLLNIYHYFTKFPNLIFERKTSGSFDCHYDIGAILNIWHYAKETRVHTHCVLTPSDVYLWSYYLKKCRNIDSQYLKINVVN